MCQARLTADNVDLPEWAAIPLADVVVVTERQ
jgi:hypothetical protein